VDEKNSRLSFLLENIREWAIPIIRRKVARESDDVTSQVVEDLWGYLVKYLEDDELSEITLDEVKGITANIIRWRVADYYRKPLYREITIDGDINEIVSDEPSLTRTVHMKDVLKKCIEILSKYPEKDRNIILYVLAQDRKSALTPTERQRYIRLRKKLKTDLEKFYKSSITDLFF